VDEGREAGARKGLFESVWLRGALVVAAVEAILVAVGVIPRIVAVVIAGLVIALYFLWGRSVERAVVRQTVWAVALSQAVVLFVPIVLWAIGAALIVLLAVVAALVVVALLVDR
jgi:hypothetical protein